MIMYINGCHKVLSDGTLMTFSKKQLIQYIRMLENNYQDEAERRKNLQRQVKNLFECEEVQK